MAETVYTGGGQLTDTDIKYVKWEGRTKGGKAVRIELEKALCRSNPDWKFEEKNDTTAEVEFEGLYDDAKLAKGDRTEPWKITLPDGLTEGVDEIILGVGKFSIGTSKDDAKPVALTRGGGSFIVEREFREINADEDPGAVAGRIVKEMGRPKLKLIALQWLTKVNQLYPCVVTPTTTANAT